jgi:hypothetical protein
VSAAQLLRRRKSKAHHLLDWFDSYTTDATPALKEDILDGFGDRSAGEDRFDAFVGLHILMSMSLQN